MVDVSNSKTQIPLSTQDTVYNFIEEVFIGIETKVYQMTSQKVDFKDKLSTKEGMLYGVNFLEFYLNFLNKLFYKCALLEKLSTPKFLILYIKF